MSGDVPSIVMDDQGGMRTPLEIATDQIHALEDENAELRRQIAVLGRGGNAEQLANDLMQMREAIRRQRRVLKDTDKWLGEISKDWKNPIVLTKRSELQAAIRENTCFTTCRRRLVKMK